MAKATLSRAYVYGGRIYGPGEAEIDDEEAFKAVRAKEEALAKPASQAVAIVAPAPGDADPLADAVGDELAATLRAGGFADLAAVRAASDDELLAVQGVGPARLAQIRTAAR